MIHTQIKITLCLILAVPLLSQNLAGTWILKQQYRNGELIFNKPYLRYEFIPPDTWNSYIKQGYDKGLFDFKEQGIYKIKYNKIGLLYWDSENIDWGTYFIQGYTLIIIEFMYAEGLARMIFKREMTLQHI